MSPRETANAIVEEFPWFRRHAAAYYIPEMTKLIAMAIAAERQACAAIAIDLATRHRVHGQESHASTAFSIAAAIRARGETGGTAS